MVAWRVDGRGGRLRFSPERRMRQSARESPLSAGSMTEVARVVLASITIKSCSPS